MNRWVIAVVMGLTVMGCAAGVEDPQPAPTPEPEQKEPPAQTFSGQLAENPYEGIARGALIRNIPSLPPLQKPPVPGPQSAPAQE